MKLGGIHITTDKPENLNKILNKERYDPDIFGEDPYIHLQDKDLRTWLCINKYGTNKNIKAIKEKIESLITTAGNIKVEGIHRKKREN